VSACLESLRRKPAIVRSGVLPVNGLGEERDGDGDFAAILANVFLKGKKVEVGYIVIWFIYLHSVRSVIGLSVSLQTWNEAGNKAAAGRLCNSRWRGASTWVLSLMLYSQLFLNRDFT
jgi:hypothetical protein